MLTMMMMMRMLRMMMTMTMIKTKTIYQAPCQVELENWVNSIHSACAAAFARCPQHDHDDENDDYYHV